MYNGRFEIVGSTQCSSTTTSTGRNRTPSKTSGRLIAQPGLKRRLRRGVEREFTSDEPGVLDGGDGVEGVVDDTLASGVVSFG